MNAGKGFHSAYARAYPVERSVLHKAEVEWTLPAPVKALKERLGDTPFDLVVLLVTPCADFHEIVSDAHALFGDTKVMACTTAGEITSNGYTEGYITAIGFPKSGFASTSIMIRDTGHLSAQTVVDQINLERMALQNNNPGFGHAFAFLAVDGLSLSEDTLAASIAPALSETPLFGGSAGDGTDFRHTMVSLNGAVEENAAVLTLFRSRYRSRVFSLDHLLPTDRKMVVTDADPANRIVKTINAEPAAREYARIVGKDPEQLDRFTFAAHPVVVRIGNAHHVRAIQQINDAGEMVFFSAVDEGMVLTVANATDMAAHLEAELDAMAKDGALSDIFCCDCILRRIEAEQTQATRRISDILARHNVVGFSTYGEQIGPLHVNQTMSGVAFYLPTETED